MVEYSLEEITSLEEGMKRLEELASGGLGMEKLSGYVMSLASKFGLSAASANELIEKLSGIADGIKDFAVATELASTAGDMLQQLMSKSAEAMEDLKRATGDAGVSTGGLITKFVALSPIALRLQDVPVHFDAIGSSAKGSQAQISELIKNTTIFDKLSSGLSAANGGILFKKEDIQNYAKMLDASRNLQRGMLEAAGASGNLTEFLKKAGSEFQNLDAMANAYNTQVTTIAASTGRMPEEVGKFAKSLALMPGALNDINTTTTIAGTKISMLEAAFRFADGTGQDTTTVFEDLAFAAEKIGLQGEDALQFLDRMKQASDATGLPMKDLREAIKASAEEFAMLGDNTDASINLMGRLAPALRDVGVAPSQVNKIFRDLTSSMSNMSTAQKAFLSSSTGGASGLQGAFQIEQMMAEGKVDEVFSKMQQNLRSKFGGGPIVTREQASQSPEQASQYQRQVMLMMSPAMGGMAKDTSSAAKLIEAMSKGDLTGFAKGLKGDSEQEKDAALRSTMITGSKIQEKTNTALNELNANLARISGNSAAALGKMLPGVDATIRDAAGFKSRKEVQDDAAQLSRANPFTGNGFGSDVDVNALYERIGNSKEVKEAWDAGNPLDMIKSVFKSGMNEVGFSNQTRVPYDSQQQRSATPRPEVQPVRAALTADNAASPTSDQRTAMVIQRAEAQKDDKKKPETTTAQQGGTTTIQTVCGECQKIIARDAANQAIKHNHGNTTNQAFLGVSR